MKSLSNINGCIVCLIHYKVFFLGQPTADKLEGYFSPLLKSEDVKQLSAAGMKCYHHYLARKKQHEAHTSQQDFQVADTAGNFAS